MERHGRQRTVQRAAPAWAAIPAAGQGTRLRPATLSVPKVLLPVGLRPMIDWSLEEAVASGVGGIVVVRAPHHNVVQEYVEHVAREARFAAVDIQVIEQPQPTGIGDALSRCLALTGSGPLGVIVPDNWFQASEPVLAQVAESYRNTGLTALGLIDVSADEARLLGNVGKVDLSPIDVADYRIRRLGDKAPGNYRTAGQGTELRGCARYVLTAEFFDALRATGPPEEGEWDDVPAFQLLARSGRLVGRRLDAVHFDVGQQAGYLAAGCYLAGKVNGNDA